MLDDGVRGFSPRELTIIEGLASGHSNKIMARQLTITEATVKVHVKAVLRKLRVSNRTQAAIWWHSNRPNGAKIMNGQDGGIDIVAKQLDKEIEETVMSEQRPVVPTSRTMNPTDVERVKLHCESILHMAFQVWLRQVRGNAPFIGPVDSWKFNEMKNLLFSINGDNGDF